MQPTSSAFKYTMGAKARGIGFAEEQSPTLSTQADSNAVLTPMMAVRRLTPVECERLQGFPDSYTDIKSKNKPTPDGPRYKALGNSMAVPVMAWIGQRIEQVEAICKQNK
jgi:DNA (cytosine-5)-methyltransferase 1